MSSSKINGCNGESNGCDGESNGCNGESRVLLNRRPAIPVLYTTGTFYQVGYDVGRTFRDRIRRYWKGYRWIKDVLVPYLETPKGKRYYESTLDVCKSVYPQYIREIEGIADGSGFPFKNLFSLCLSIEIGNVFAPAMTKNEACVGCTDVFVNRTDCKILGHTEDAPYIVNSCGYLVSATIVENDKELESFTTFCYPGIIGGFSFGFNRHGMAFSCNAMYTETVVENTPPRIFLCREVAKSKNIDEAYETLKAIGHGVSYSFNMNIVDVKNPSQMWTIEVGCHAGDPIIDMHVINEEADESKPCHYIRTNKIERLKDVGIVEFPNLSSLARRKRAKEMDPPRTREDVLRILGDVTNKEYPIYRVPITKYDTDHGCEDDTTVLAGIINVLENRVDFYRENPSKPGQRPLFHFQIKDGSN